MFPARSISEKMKAFASAYANWDGVRTVCLTFDQDWAPDFMLSHVLDILAEYDATATFLATGPSECLSQRAIGAGHEIGLHPNLAPNSTQGGDVTEIVRGLRQHYPDAVGTRFHVLWHSYRDLLALGRENFAYDVSTLRMHCPYLLPAWHDDLNMTLLTYCWEDGYTADGSLFDSADSIALDLPGMKIVNFHPLNVYLNCAHNDQKAAFQHALPNLGGCSAHDARCFRHDGTGIETVLRELLQKLHAGGIRTATLQTLCNEFRNAV